MDELLDVVADAVRRAGGQTRTAVGRFPEPAANTVYVIVPHEYFVLVPPEQQPSPDLLARTIGFCVEHPGNLSFERTAYTLPRLAFGVDINEDSTAELRRRGNRVEHFQLGYSPLWDRWGGDLNSTRTIDLTYLGTEDRRRSRLLGSYWQDLDHLTTRLLTPPHEMMGPPRVDFLPGEAKFHHLANSRFLLNLHRGRSNALEWVRVLEALCNGCVVLTEPSNDVAPLKVGRHLISARAETLGAVAATMAMDSTREQELRSAGYEFARKELDLPGSAAMLLTLAKQLVTGMASSPPKISTPLAEMPRSSASSISVDTPSWDIKFAPSPSGPKKKSDTGLYCLSVDRTNYARKTAKRKWVAAASAAVFPQHPQADVDVLITQRPGDPDPSELINDLYTGTMLPRQILVGIDGVALDQRSRAYQHLVHEFPLGRGYTRNALLERSKAPWILVLDAEMRASKYLMERFMIAAEKTDVVHCPVSDPVAGLVGALPPEARRLLRLPYLGSGYLVRRSVVTELGNWTENALLDGLEDHVFWRRIAAQNRPATLVQQVFLHRSRPDPAPRPLDLDPHHVWSIANGSDILHTP